MRQLIKPKHLQKGDVIGIVSPSAPLAGLVFHRVAKGLKMLESIGFKVKIGKHALKITGHTAGNPKQRAEDINNFFKDKNIRAIFSFIGGNHSNQILKYLDFDLIKRNPKVFLGYSDITVLHFALYTQANLVSFYGPAVLTQFAENPKTFLYTQQHFEKAVMYPKSIRRIEPSLYWTDEVLDWFKKEDLKRSRKMKKNNDWQWLKKGEANGIILGGCITSMMHLRGTRYWSDFSESILFWEIPESSGDFTKGESPESIDAHLTDLELSGVFDEIRGMIIGRPFGYTKKQTSQLIQIIKERTKDYNFPILFNVDIGHSDPMITVPLGIKIRINSHKNLFEFTESGTI